MAGKNATTFDSVMRDLRAGKYSPVYILMGEEGYYIDLIADYIEGNALAPDERDFNLSVVYGMDCQPSQVADMARRFPMMAERQVVIVKEAQNIKSWDALERYVEKPAPTTVLVICHKNGTIDGRRRIVSKAAAVGVVFTSAKVREGELPSFIAGYLRERGAAIDAKSAQMIAESIGADLCRIAGELDKLLVSMGGGNKVVTPEMVQDMIGVSKDFNGFELRSAIVQKDVFKANLILDYFRSNPKSSGKTTSYSLVPLLFSYFQNLLIAHYAPNPKTEESIARWLGLRGAWAAREYITGMRNYSGTKAMAIISKIRETDAKSKGLDNPNTPIGELLRELVFYILH